MIQNINKYPVKHTKNGIKLGFINICYGCEDKNGEEPKIGDVKKIFQKIVK